MNYKIRLVFLMLCLALLWTRQGCAQVLSPEQRVTGLQHASSIYATPAGEIYIVEQNRNRLLKFNMQLQRVDSLGAIGFGDYQLDSPIDVDATNGLKIYVTDYNNRRIQVFDRRAQFLTTIKTRNPMFDAGDLRPTMVTVNAFGEVFFFDEASNAIIKYNRQGRYEQSIGLTKSDIETPIIALKCTNDRLFLIDDTAEQVFILNQMGGLLGFTGPLGNLKAITLDEHWLWILADNKLFAATHTGRVLHEFELDSPREWQGMSITGNSLFMLTKSQVYILPLPQIKR